MPRLFFSLLFLPVVLVLGQPSFPTKFTPDISERADVKKAMAFIDAHFEEQVAEWIKLTEVPAPSGHEAARAAYVKAEFEKAGLTAKIDASGNVEPKLCTERLIAAGRSATLLPPAVPGVAPPHPSKSKFHPESTCLFV